MAAAGSDLTALDATALALLVRRREASPVEIVRAHLDRIAALDASLGAFVLVRAEQALAEARSLEQDPGLDGRPLAGVPVAIKDNVDVQGEPTRHGSRAIPARPADRDDELVRRLRAAGAVVVGKTRLPELAIWPFAESHGETITRNPWEPARDAGGSSSGSAAAVAARLCPVALGSDGGGSIRLPSACCGVVGLKPGPSLVPVAGGESAHWLGLTQFGPIARTVRDAALLLDVLSGTRAHASAAPPGPLRIALSTRHATAGAKVSAEAIAAVDAVAALLEEAGHRVARDDPPYPATLGLRFSRRWLAGIAEDVEALVPPGAGTRGALEPRTAAMARAGRWIARLGLAAPVEADGYGAAMASWLARCDVLITPPLASTAVSAGRWRGRRWGPTLLGVASWTNTAMWNLAGLPAMVVPAGLSPERLPLSVQLVGSAGGEATLLAVARQIEERRPWPSWSQEAVIAR